MSDCAIAQDTFQNLTFTMSGYNFTIPSSAYVVNATQENEWAELFQDDKCVFMIMPHYFESDQYMVGLGQGFLWQYFAEFDFDTTSMHFGVNYYAE